MIHQITFVGSQLLPVYVGIKEFKPDKVHFIISNESKGNISLLKPLLASVSFTESICNPFDFYSIKGVCEHIIDKYDSDDEFALNLTGGTKIMVLAAISVIQERNLKGFYINQDDTILELPNYGKKQIKTEISIQEFFDISGHHLFSAKKLNDYSNEDLKNTKIIENFANNDKRYVRVTSYVRKKYNDRNHPFPKTGKEVLNDGTEFTWDAKSIKILANGKSLLNLNSENIIDLFFNAAWWELLVSAEVAKWDKTKEILIKCELPFKTDKQTTKNEIDILINSGKKLIFIECKSGYIKQDDINKMRVIKLTYGGVISKSVLVSRFLPTPTILEKCKELDIEVFFSYAFHNNQVNQLSKIIPLLNSIINKATI